ncbi:MAG: hypothetical protein HY319_13075 [Armatimonadetes bacterium]|nr:hypothetical protein [Armatimonadota bacterium]
MTVFLTALFLFGCGAPSREPASTPAVPASTPTVESPEAVDTASPSPDNAVSPATPSGSALETPSSSPGGTPAAAQGAGKLKTMILTDKEKDNVARVQFPSTTPEIFLVFTMEETVPGTTLKTVWKSRDNPKIDMVDSTQAVEGRRRHTLSAVRPQNGWPLGHYRVTLFVGPELVSSAEFEVVREVKPVQVGKPEYAILTDDLGQRKERDKFAKAADEILLIVATDHLQEGTPVKSIWIAEEADQLDQGELVDTSTLSAPPPDQDGLFIFTPPEGGFHPGRYRVDLYVQDQRIASRPFRIVE